MSPLPFRVNISGIEQGQIQVSVIDMAGKGVEKVP